MSEAREERSGGRPAAEPARLEADVRALEGERHPRTSPGSLADARDWIAGRLEDLGLRVEERSFRDRGGEHRNVVGLRPGRDPDRPRVLVGAHFDTVPGSPGADDNASGVAATLECARLLSDARPAAGIEFTAFNLEEPRGMSFGVGSRHYAREARRRGQEYAGCLVLEMVGYTDPEPGAQRRPPLLFWKTVPDEGTFLAAVSDWKSRSLLGAFEEAAAGAAPELDVVTFRSPLRGWVVPATRLSDHSRFWDEGYPALMLTDTAFLRNPHYHRRSDRASTLDYHFMAGVVDATAEAASRLAGA